MVEYLEISLVFLSVRLDFTSGNSTIMFRVFILFRENNDVGSRRSKNPLELPAKSQFSCLPTWFHRVLALDRIHVDKACFASNVEVVGFFAHIFNCLSCRSSRDPAACRISPPFKTKDYYSLFITFHSTPFPLSPFSPFFSVNLYCSSISSSKICINWLKLTKEIGSCTTFRLWLDKLEEFGWRLAEKNC